MIELTIKALFVFFHYHIMTQKIFYYVPFNENVCMVVYLCLYLCVYTCRGLHLSVIHSQTDAVKNLTEVIAAIPGEDMINMRNDLYQACLYKHTHTQRHTVFFYSCSSNNVLYVCVILDSTALGRIDRAEGSCRGVTGGRM